jgi:DNA-binding NtrC family response regulator
LRAFAPSAEDRTAVRILVVDDDRTLREGCLSILASDGYEVTGCGRSEEALRLVQTKTWDIIFCDLFLTPVTGLQILGEALAHHAETLVVMMTGNPSVESSLEVLRAGAWDYLPKPFNASNLLIFIGRATHALSVARLTAQQQAHGDGAPDRGPLILGRSPALRRAVDLARRVAGTDASVMITGESGTGKEVIAQFIHANSRRASRPLVPVNCAALPELLLESELFGHRRGAFTGADRDKPGLLETANGGTFFLDELTEAPLSTQAKLLRVIQDGVLRRVGSEQQDAIVDVRFISATNREPEAAVAQGMLREDLFYRLHVVPIRLPPLRERSEDVPLLSAHFLAVYWKKHGGAAAKTPTWSAAALQDLQAREWRGNVRELQNLIEHVVVLAEPGAVIQPSDLPADGLRHNGDATHAIGGAPFGDAVMTLEFRAAKDAVIARFEREYLARLVSQSRANMSKAARVARVDRTTLYRLMEKHGLTRGDMVEEA